MVTIHKAIVVLASSMIVVVAAGMLSSAVFAGHSGLTVPPGDTFLLGGNQGAAIMVAGKNVGRTNVTILLRAAGKETVIADVSPGGAFEHRYSVGQTALIRNQSATTAAQLSVDFTGSPSNLSMRYSLPQKN